MERTHPEYGGQRVAAVILARNEQATIREVVEGAARLVSEVVVMDGHSTDQTAAIARAAGAIVYRDPGRGKGSAIRRSLELVNADILVFIDADGSHDPADIPKLVMPLVRREAELCVGSRFTGGSEELSLSFAQLIRTIGNILMNIAINKRWHTALTDTLNGFRAVRRDAVLAVRLTEDTHTIEQEMVMKMLRHRYRVANAPAHEYPRRFGESHINIWKEWPKFVWCVVANIARKDLPSPERWWRSPWALLGLALVATAVLLPSGTYAPLPSREPLGAVPIDGIVLLRIALLLGGLGFVIPAIRRWHFTPLDSSARAPIPAVASDDLTPRVAHRLLLAITLVALVLRLVNLGSSLWLDEITPIEMYRDASAVQVLMSYSSSNNHLLNTLLVKLATRFLGEREWVVRLPAMIFGVATVPAVYWVSRLMLSRRASLAVAALLATSYHHVFFSQNARGYSAYLLFSLLATGFYVKGLRTDRRARWAWYVVTMVLDFASHLISAFVVAGHVLVGVVAVVLVRRRGGPWLPLCRRLAAVFGVTGILVFQLYAAAMPQMYAYMKTVYAGDPAAGYTLFSPELVAEVARSLSLGLGAWAPLLALIALPVVGLGLARSLVRNWALVLALALPAVLQALFFAVRHLVFSPRFFLLALPLVLLILVQGLYTVAGYVARAFARPPGFARRLAAAVVLLFAVGSLLQLRSYYVIPKQDYLGSLEFIEHTRRPDEIVIVIHLAEHGFRFYGGHRGLREGERYFYVRSVAALDGVLSANPGRRSLLVTTFPRALRLSYPELYERLGREWVVVRSFPGTVGDGDISVWKQRGPPSRT